MSNETGLISIKNLMKFMLATILLLSLFKMPYGYYQFVRVVSFLGFAFLSYLDYKEDMKLPATIFAIIALLFNPISKYYFGRDGWRAVDIIAIIIMAVTYIIEKLQERKSHKV